MTDDEKVKTIRAAFKTPWEWSWDGPDHLDVRMRQPLKLTSFFGDATATMEAKELPIVRFYRKPYGRKNQSNVGFTFVGVLEDVAIYVAGPNDATAEFKDQVLADFKRENGMK